VKYILVAIQYMHPIKSAAGRVGKNKNGIQTAVSANKNNQTTNLSLTIATNRYSASEGHILVKQIADII
jgi:hypothetical protein